MQSEAVTVIVREWRPIPDFPDYFVRSDGVVESRASGKLKRLKPWITEGYRQYSLRGRKLYAHQLVMLAFVGPPPPSISDPVVDHRDFNRLNNELDNLRWYERLMNMRRTPATAHLYP